MLKSTKHVVMHSYPGMVALVTSKFQTEANIMSAGWHSYISYEPPFMGLPDFQKLTIPLYVGRSNYIILNEKTELKNYYRD
jgi:hypothetical protein